MTAESALEGKLAVVVGARGRLGPTWIETLSAAGAHVVGVDLAAGEEGGDVRVADVTDRGALDAVRDEVVAEHGAPAVLVNSAGLDQPPSAAATTSLVEDVPSADFRQVVDVNLLGTFHSLQSFGSSMAAAGFGSIVNIGSLYATIAPDPRLYDHMPVDPPFLKPPAYGASKAAVVQLTRYFARLWGPRGVRVNTLSPGGVRGDQDEQFLEKYCARVPLGRMAEPADLAGPLLFLASDASRYLTGHELRVDGGFTA